MKTKMETVKKNNTWVLTKLPKGKKDNNLKWVYKLKNGANEKVIKHKARIVTKGYLGKYRVDYEEVFAPVSRLDIVHLLLALASKKQLEGTPFRCKVCIFKWGNRGRSLWDLTPGI